MDGLLSSLVGVYPATALSAAPALSLQCFFSRCTYAVGNHDFIEAYKCQTVIVQYPLSLVLTVQFITGTVDGLEFKMLRS